MAMYAKVRRMRLRDGLSISEIARRTSLSRNTIKAWLRGPIRSEMTYRRSAAPKKIGPYEARLRDALVAGRGIYDNMNIAAPQHGHQDLLDVGAKRDVIHRPVEHGRGRQFGGA